MGGSRAHVFASRDRGKLVVAVAGGLAVGYAAMLAMSFFLHIWILDARGHPIANDFAAFRAAGHLAREGHALAAYDPRLQHAAEASVVGHPFTATLGWSYPPLFFFVAYTLAALPYTSAFVMWCVATLALSASAVAAIAERRTAFLVVCAAPWSLLALMPGQNGCLTAALIGLALLTLERRPLLSGLFLGLLSYKPQFGILFPFALAAGGYWRAFASAAATALAANGFAAAIFGVATIDAFFHALTAAAGNHLIVTGLGWNKLQSVYGLARAIGFAGNVAWSAQVVATAAIALGLLFVWRKEFPFALKAALLAAAIPLATPYVFVYDLPVLGIALAFLFRQRDFDAVEGAMLAVAAPCLFGFLWLPVPSAVFTSLAIAAIVARRAIAIRHQDHIDRSWAAANAVSR
jgi:arabinofuranan 3-O-arabinosyltransferase